MYKTILLALYAAFTPVSCDAFAQPLEGGGVMNLGARIGVWSGGAKFDWESMANGLLDGTVKEIYSEVEILRSNALYRLMELEYLDLPNIKTLDRNFLYSSGYPKLSYINLPSVTSIATDVFYGIGDRNNTTIINLNSLTELVKDRFVFGQCFNYELNLPNCERFGGDLYYAINAGTVNIPKIASTNLDMSEPFGGAHSMIYNCSDGRLAWNGSAWALTPKS